METFFLAVVILIIAITAGMLFNVWFHQQKQIKKRDEILKKTIAKIEENFRNFIKEKDWDQVQNSLTEKFSIFLHGDPYLIEGNKEARQWYEAMLKEVETTSVHNQAVKILTDDVAVVTFTFSSHGVRGDKPFEGTGKTTRIWQKIGDDEWKLVHEHTSYNE
ncbi:MAG: DUF4440 domain-containing protein [candidate division KSB1 bacterium]|nr:DUF4440 domain-containing protein [candidate division KSB1 bacterium]MDQ7066348.1 DUF4440 domain-containing protein [candidate division KSB1 bacterium]